MELILTSGAVNDLNEIWDFLFHEVSSPDVAVRILNKLRKQFLSLLEFPSLGRECFELEDKSPGLRCLTVDGYVIYYRKTSKKVEIANVLHSRRDKEQSID